MSTIHILHKDVICTHYDRSHGDKHKYTVSTQDGYNSFVATAWSYITYSTGQQHKMIQVETDDGMLVLDAKGAECLMVALKRLYECDLDRPTQDHSHD
jgi:hypothetical protein